MFDLFAILNSDNRFLLAALIYVSAYFDFKSSPPDYFAVDDEEKPFTEDWLEEYAKTCQKSVILIWGEDDRKRFEYHKETPLIIQLDNFAQTTERVIECLQFYPWTVATFLTTYPEASRPPLLHDDFYNLPRSLRWGIAFKQEGHKKMPSRRYLAHGPWRILRNEVQDITLIQFHDINATVPVALLQAKPGHQFIGLMGEHMGTVWMERNEQDYGEEELAELLAHYSPNEKMLCYTINNRLLPRSELRDICTARWLQPLGQDQPINRIAYMFVNEGDAWQTLHELWLREIECWAIIEGEKVRLDVEYTPPPPEKPEWVRRLESQDTNTAA